MPGSEPSRWEDLFSAVRDDAASDAAWASLYVAVWPLLVDWTIARYGLDGDAAGSVLQDSFLQYREKVKQGAVPEPSLAHLRRFVQKTALMRLRAERRFVPLHDLFESAGEPAREDVTLRILVEEVMDRLDPSCAFLLREKYLGGRTSSELAEALGLSDANVRVQLHRCRERFREVLARGPG